MDNRRKVDRLPSFLGGTIIYNRNRWSTPCVVKNLSRTGAKLTGSNLPVLPDRFELSVPQKKSIYSVKMKWRDADLIGVEIEAVQPMSSTDQPHRPRAA
jgi:hypothetical protein